MLSMYNLRTVASCTLIGCSSIFFSVGGNTKIPEAAGAAVRDLRESCELKSRCRLLVVAGVAECAFSVAHHKVSFFWVHGVVAG